MKSRSRIMRFGNNDRLRARLYLVLADDLREAYAAFVQRGSQCSWVRDRTRETRSVGQFNLDTGSFTGIPVDSQGLDGLPGKLCTLNVVVWHESRSSQTFQSFNKTRGLQKKASPEPGCDQRRFASKGAGLGSCRVVLAGT